MKDIVIANYVRSPQTPAGKGALTRVRPDDLAAQVVRALVARTGIDFAEVEDLLVGCAFPEGEQVPALVCTGSPRIHVGSDGPSCATTTRW